MESVGDTGLRRMRWLDRLWAGSSSGSVSDLCESQTFWSKSFTSELSAPCTKPPLFFAQHRALLTRAAPHLYCTASSLGVCVDVCLVFVVVQSCVCDVGRHLSPTVGLVQCSWWGVGFRPMYHLFQAVRALDGPFPGSVVHLGSDLGLSISLSLDVRPPPPAGEQAIARDDVVFESGGIWLGGRGVLKTPNNFFLPLPTANRQPLFNPVSVVLCLAHVLTMKQRASP